MLKNDVGYLIKSINDKLKVRADAELKQYHLTISQSRVLVYLRSRGDYCWTCFPHGTEWLCDVLALRRWAQ